MSEKETNYMRHFVFKLVLFIILEFIEDGERSRATVQTIDTGLSMPSTHLIRVKDLVVEESKTRQLARYFEVLDIESGFDKSIDKKFGVECIQSLKSLD